jgi:hypothetical protein
VPEDFVDIIADMMEKDPGRRVSTAAEVVARLEPWAPGSLQMPAPQPTRSPWMAPPLPAHADDEDELDVTKFGNDEDNDSASASGVSQQSQGTDPLASDETHSNSEHGQRIAPSLPVPPPAVEPASGHLATVLITLAVAVPLSVVIGALLTLVIQGLMK